MCPRRSFQRARAPEEKEVRRRAILAAARLLVDEVGPVELSLSELARRSGVSKPNIYRYFESREEVLLHVWVEEVRLLAERLATDLPRAARSDVAAVRDIVVDAFAAQPVLCELMTIVASVLERNISVDAVILAKRALYELVLRVATLLHERLPSVALDDCMWAANASGTYLAGLWPSANPGPVASAAYQRPDLAPYKPDFVRDFRRFLDVMLHGLMQAKAAVSSPRKSPSRKT